MRVIHTLRTHQRCGAVTITHDPITDTTTVRTLFNAVAYIHAHDGVLDLYGLGNCRTFELNHKRYIRYVENSRVRVKNGVIFENKLRRSLFTPPSTSLRLKSVFSVRLRCIELNGVTTLKEVAPQCIDEEAQVQIHLHPGTRFETALPALSARCRLGAGAVISAATIHSATSRLLWQLNDLELIIDGPSRVSGIHVTRALKTTLHTGDACVLDVGVDEGCEVTTHQTVVQASYDELMGRAPPTPRRPVFNEHGMVVFVDDIPQAVLDASRAAYEEETPAASATPLFALSGNTKRKDEPGDGCRVCMTNKAVVVMTGCGHTATCVSCAETMRYCLSTCPLCRTEIGTAVVPFV